VHYGYYDYATINEIFKNFKEKEKNFNIKNIPNNHKRWIVNN